MTFLKWGLNWPNREVREAGASSNARKQADIGGIKDSLSAKERHD